MVRWLIDNRLAWPIERCWCATKTIQGTKFIFGTEESQIHATYLHEKAQKAKQAQNKNSANYNKLRDDPSDCIPRSECEYMSCA